MRFINHIERWTKATDVLKEDLENTTSLFVDETRDTLDTATTSETANSRLGDALDVVTKDLAVTLSAALSETLRERERRKMSTFVLFFCGINKRVNYLAALSTSRHVC
jgi:hypothetical protein